MLNSLISNVEVQLFFSLVSKQSTTERQHGEFKSPDNKFSFTNVLFIIIFKLYSSTPDRDSK